MASRKDAPNAESQRDLPMPKLLGEMAVFVLLGFPLVGYLWKTINDLLALEVATMRLLITVPVIGALAVLVWQLARAVDRWTGTADAP